MRKNEKRSNMMSKVMRKSEERSNIMMKVMKYSDSLNNQWQDFNDEVHKVMRENKEIKDKLVFQG